MGRVTAVILAAGVDQQRYNVAAVNCEFTLRLERCFTAIIKLTFRERYRPGL